MKQFIAPVTVTSCTAAKASWSSPLSRGPSPGLLTLCSSCLPDLPPGKDACRCKYSSGASSGRGGGACHIEGNVGSADLCEGSSYGSAVGSGAGSGCSSGANAGASVSESVGANTGTGP